MRSLCSNLSTSEGWGVMYTPPPDVAGTGTIGGGVSILILSKDNGGCLLLGDQLSELVERATTVGSSECDICGRTPLDANKTKFDCCSRCKLAYYCSKECQKAHWKGSHKHACRRPHDIQPGDFLHLTNLPQKPKWNGHIVRAVQLQQQHLQHPPPSATGSSSTPDPGLEHNNIKQHRWIIEDISSNEKQLLVAIENLVHIQPAATNR